MVIIFLWWVNNTNRLFRTYAFNIYLQQFIRKKEGHLFLGSLKKIQVCCLDQMYFCIMDRAVSVSCCRCCYGALESKLMCEQLDLFAACTSVLLGCRRSLRREYKMRIRPISGQTKRRWAIDRVEWSRTQRDKDLAFCTTNPEHLSKQMRL